MFLTSSWELVFQLGVIITLGENEGISDHTVAFPKKVNSKIKTKDSFKPRKMGYSANCNSREASFQEAY